MTSLQSEEVRECRKWRVGEAGEGEDEGLGCSSFVLSFVVSVRCPFFSCRFSCGGCELHLQGRGHTRSLIDLRCARLFRPCANAVWHDQHDVRGLLAFSHLVLFMSMARTSGRSHFGSTVRNRSNTRSITPSSGIRRPRSRRPKIRSRGRCRPPRPGPAGRRRRTHVAMDGPSRLRAAGNSRFFI